MEQGKYIDLDKAPERPTKEPVEPMDSSVKKAEELEQAKVEYEARLDEANTIFKEQVRVWIERKNNFRNNKRKAYNIIKTFCTASMITRLEEHANRDQFNGDPLATIKVINMTTHDPVRGRYEYATLMESQKGLINFKQAPNESLLDYFRRFKQAKEVTEGYVATDSKLQRVEPELRDISRRFCSEQNQLTFSVFISKRA